jgi:hypothetical protein
MVNPVAGDRDLLEKIREAHPEAKFQGTDPLTHTNFVQRHPAWLRWTCQSVKDANARFPYFLSHVLSFTREPVFAMQPPGPPDLYADTLIRPAAELYTDLVFMPTAEQAAHTLLGQLMRLLHELAPLFPENKGIGLMRTLVAKPEFVRVMLALSTGAEPTGALGPTRLWPRGSPLSEVTPFSAPALNHYWEQRFGDRAHRLVAFTDHLSRFDAAPGPAASGGGSASKTGPRAAKVRGGCTGHVMDHRI